MLPPSGTLLWAALFFFFLRLISWLPLSNTQSVRTMHGASKHRRKKKKRERNTHETYRQYTVDHEKKKKKGKKKYHQSKHMPFS